MPRSNYFKSHTVTKEGLAREQVCRACHGSGDDPHIDGADCMTCWGDGTIPLTEREQSTDPA